MTNYMLRALVSIYRERCGISVDHQSVSLHINNIYVVEQLISDSKYEKTSCVYIMKLSGVYHQTSADICTLVYMMAKGSGNLL